jgi:hypothetical protein
MTNISSYISEFLDNFRQFVDLLDVNQLVALVNIIGFTSILATLFSLTTLLLGDFLIDKLKLEIKFPKLARVIRWKQTLNKGSMIFYLTSLYITIVVFISLNIYMILLKYFI